MLEIILQNYILVSIGVIVVAFYLYLSRNLNYWTKKGLTGPKPIPIFGTVYAKLLRAPTEVELEWYRQNGKIYGVFNGNKPVITVAEPELIKQILMKDFHTFRNRKLIPKSNSLQFKNVSVSADDDWKRMRAIVSPTFSSGKLKKMYGLMNQCCDDLIASLDNNGKTVREINAIEQMGAYTMDVIARCAFGVVTNTHKNPNNEFTKNAYEFFDAAVWKMVLFFMMPFNLTVIARQVLNIGHESLKFFSHLSRHLIEQRKNTKEEHNDFMQLLIDAERKADIDYGNDNHLSGTSNDDRLSDIKPLNNVMDKTLTEDEIISHCFLFFFAGYETTTTILSSCAYELALHDDVQNKLFEEVNAAFNGTENIDYETLLSLPYLDAVFSETLRKYPPGVRIERRAMDDYVLGDTGIVIPNGMQVEIPIYGIHYDPQYYENPHQFNPNRFMPENRCNLKPFTYLPFGAGPRNCLAMRFATLEAKLAIANIIRRFRLLPTSNTDIPVRIKVNPRVLKPMNIYIGIEKRLIS